MSCPPSAQRGSGDALPVSVGFGLPTVGGVPVDKGACVPASGAVFGLGSSGVTCMADQEELATTCSFSVTVTPPDLACPPPVTSQSLDALPVPIIWDLPTVPNTPVETFSCAPMPGTAFPIGTSTVTCTADWPAVPTTADEPPPVDSCGFTVTIDPPDPTLTFTQFMSFGDSITEGFVFAGPLPAGVTALDIPAVLGGAGGPAIPGILRAVEPFSSYPTRLLTLLTPAYLTQFIAVTNQGISRERAAQGAARLPLSIQAFLPEVLLLLEGFNDINLELGLQPAGTPVDVDPIANTLRDMVLTAEARGVEVLLATLTPVTDVREASDPGTRTAVLELNDEIRRMSPQLGNGGIVDLHSALDGVPGMIGADGFHPTVAGYRRIAEVFFAEIVSRYDITPRAPGLRTGVRFKTRRK